MGMTPPPMPPERLIIFSRFPKAGTTKTRLIPTLGPEGAANLQRRMTERVLSVSRQARNTLGFEIEVCYAGGSLTDLARWLGSDMIYEPQAEGDIGSRMEMAFTRAFSHSVQTAVLIGSDIPEITSEIIGGAFDQLREVDMVLGPTRDGGYYLIGLTAAGVAGRIPHIFKGIPWSTDRVYGATLERVRKLGLSWGQLPMLADVDRPEDLAVWERCLNSGA